VVCEEGQNDNTGKRRGAGVIVLSGGLLGRTIHSVFHALGEVLQNASNGYSPCLFWVNQTLLNILDQKDE